MKHEKIFRKHLVFTGEELNDHLSALGKIGPRTRESLLDYHRKTGHVILIRRGLYAVIPTGADPDSYPVDPFLVAAKLTTDGVLSYHTALEVHGCAYSIREHLTYSTSRPVSPVTFRSHVFRGVKFPLALCGAGKEDFGIMTVDRARLEVRVTCLERTLLDVLDRPDLSGQLGRNIPFPGRDRILRSRSSGCVCSSTRQRDNNCKSWFLSGTTSRVVDGRRESSQNSS